MYSQLSESVRDGEANLVVPCPNAAVGHGNKDKRIFAPAPAPARVATLQKDSSSRREVFSTTAADRMDADSLRLLRFVGRIIGIGIRTDVFVPLDLATHIWQLLTGAAGLELMSSHPRRGSEESTNRFSVAVADGRWIELEPAVDLIESHLLAAIDENLESRLQQLLSTSDAGSLHDQVERSGSAESTDVGVVADIFGRERPQTFTAFRSDGVEVRMQGS